MNVKHTKLWLVVSAAVFLMSMPLVSSADDCTRTCGATKEQMEECIKKCEPKDIHVE